ncbi:hypothetical protein CBL_09396 [Carabus blaptoides fortunei]
MFAKIFTRNLVIFLGIFNTLVYGQGYQVRTEVLCQSNNVKLQCGGGESLVLAKKYQTTLLHSGARHVIRQICHNKPECTFTLRMRSTLHMRKIRYKINNYVWW